MACLRELLAIAFKESRPQVWWTAGPDESWVQREIRALMPTATHLEVDLQVVASRRPGCPAVIGGRALHEGRGSLRQSLERVLSADEASLTVLGLDYLVGFGTTDRNIPLYPSPPQDETGRDPSAAASSYIPLLTAAVDLLNHYISKAEGRLLVLLPAVAATQRSGALVDLKPSPRALADVVPEIRDLLCNQMRGVMDPKERSRYLRLPESACDHLELILSYTSGWSYEDLDALASQIARLNVRGFTLTGLERLLRIYEPITRRIRIFPRATLTEPSDELDVPTPSIMDAVDRLHLVWEEHDDFLPPIRWLLGPTGSGKSFLAKAFAKKLSQPLLSIGLSSLTDALLGKTERNVLALTEEAASLAPCVLCIENAEQFAAEGLRSRQLLATFIQGIATRIGDRQVFILLTTTISCVATFRATHLPSLESLDAICDPLQFLVTDNVTTLDSERLWRSILPHSTCPDLSEFGTAAEVLSAARECRMVELRTAIAGI